MVKDDRVNDLVIYLGRKYDKLDIINKVCRGGEVAGLSATALASVAGVGSVFYTIANSHIDAMPSGATLASAGVVVGGLVLHAISKHCKNATKNHMELLNKRIRNVKDMDDELAEGSKLKHEKEREIERFKNAHSFKPTIVDASQIDIQDAFGIDF